MTITSCSLSVLFLWAIVGLSAGAKAKEGAIVDDKIRRMIAEAVAKEDGWKVDDVRVDEVAFLRRPSCSFYTAGNTARPVGYQINYALLGEKDLIGGGDGKVVARILDSCGADASADWWAEIVTRFYQGLGSGFVLHNEQTRTDITRKLEKAGKPFEPPTFHEGKKSLTYLVLDPELYVLYSVRATRAADGAIEVAKSKVF